MTKQYKKLVFSLRSLADLIKVSGKRIKVEFSVIHSDLERIMDLSTPDDRFEESLQEFEKNANLLLDQLEALKIYAEKMEYRTGNKLKHLIQLCAQVHLFKLVPQGDSAEEKYSANEIQIKLDQILKEVTKRLKEQVKIEKRLFKGKHLRGHFWTELVNSDKRLAKQEKHYGSLLESLGDDEIDAYEGVKRALQHIVNSDGQISHEDFNHAVQAILEYLKIVEEEFETLFDAEIDDELQESHLGDELDSLADEPVSNEVERRKRSMRTAVLLKIMRRYYSLMGRDFKEAKKLRRTIKADFN